MLTITIPGREFFNEKTNEFGSTNTITISMEHSLLSLSKWESKWHKSFLSTVDKTQDEIIDYVRCMTITQNVDPAVFNMLTQENIKEINDYLADSMTATTFSDTGKEHRSREIITSEIIYYWMVTFQIPFECEKWHINRLLTLIKVCNEKNKPPKKMSQKEIMKRNSSLNAMRKAQLHTHG